MHWDLEKMAWASPSVDVGERAGPGVERGLVSATPPSPPPPNTKPQEGHVEEGRHSAGLPEMPGFEETFGLAEEEAEEEEEEEEEREERMRHDDPGGRAEHTLLASVRSSSIDASNPRIARNHTTPPPHPRHTQARGPHTMALC